MTLAGVSRTGTGLWAAAVLLLLLCVSPLLHSFTTNINVVIAPNTQNLPRHAAAISIERRETAAIPDARCGVAHTNPLKLTPHEPLLFEEPVEGSSPYLSRRSEGLSKRRDGPLYCHDGPCIDNSCCGPDNVCGFGPDLCGEGCRSNHNATAMCGEHSEFAEMPCGMKLCCSASGWCGVNIYLPVCYSERLLTVYLVDRVLLPQCRPLARHAALSGRIQFLLHHRPPIVPLRRWQYRWPSTRNRLFRP